MNLLKISWTKDLKLKIMFTRDTLNEYIDNGLIYERKHNELDLYIYNYTQKVQYEGLWDDVTTSCRGLVLDSSQNVIARPFKKFFNYEEITDKGIVPFGERIVVMDKLDGSLGIVFNYKGKWIVSTRGSFESEQSIKAKEILDKMGFVEWVPPEWTLLFEIIYPENKIVVDYGDLETLVLTAAVHRDTGEEMDYDYMNFYFGRYISVSSLNIVNAKYTDTVNPQILQENEIDNKEGYVIKFEPSGFRMKIKFANYVRLHKIMTNFSEKRVIEALSDGIPLSFLLEGVPDEFFNEVKKIQKKFEDRRDELISIAKNRMLNAPKTEDKKEFALWALQFDDNDLLFSLYHGRDIDKQIWKKIKNENKNT